MPRFRARIEKVGVLRSVIVPATAVALLGGGKRIAVLVRYAGEVTRSTLVPAGGNRRRLVLQMSVLRRAGLDAGQPIEVELSATASSHKVPLPDDLRRALQFRPAAAAALERESPSSWRIILEMLEQARSPETRQRRIDLIVERLAEGPPRRARKPQRGSGQRT